VEVANPSLEYHKQLFIADNGQDACDVWHRPLLLISLTVVALQDTHD
jgi:hypothetical protein